MNAYLVATRYSLLVLSRNRLAMVLLLVLIPLSTTLCHFVVTRELVGFRLRATGELLRVAGVRITLLSVMINTVTLLVGYIMFSAARRADEFDRRLTADGFPRPALLLAKFTSLAITSIVVGSYSAAWVLWYGGGEQPWLLVLGAILASLLYGVIGLFLALFLPGDVEGMVTIILCSAIDCGLQNPISNPNADAGIVTMLPSYAATQTALTGAFTGGVPLTHVAVSLIWTVAVGMVAFGAFVVRTRVYVRVAA